MNVSFWEILNYSFCDLYCVILYAFVIKFRVDNLHSVKWKVERKMSKYFSSYEQFRIAKVFALKLKIKYIKIALLSNFIYAAEYKINKYFVIITFILNTSYLINYLSVYV